MALPFQKISAERGNPRIEYEGMTIDEMIANFMERHEIPGMTLAIVQAPYIPRVVGYGVSNIENKLLASPKTLWNIGQISCGYTAVAIMQLVEEDKFKVDDAIGKIVPQLPAAWQSITIRQLLGNASGIPDYTQQPSFDFSKNYNPMEILALVKDLPLLFPTGSQVSQSATNFFLLAMAVEKASGMSFENYVKKNQIEKLGLQHTKFSSDLAQLKQENVNAQGLKHKEFLKERVFIDPTEPAVGYSASNGKNTPSKINNLNNLTGYGSLLVSAEDISLWDIGLAGDILVKKKENRDLIYNGISLNNGTKVQANSGWRFYGHKGLMDIHGAIPGFSCYLSRFTDPSELLCVTLCANKENVDLTLLARMIAGAFDERLGPPKASKNVHCYESSFSVQTTMDRLEEFLKKKNVQIMARVDHSMGASRANLELRPTQTLIFGNPAMGTHLMLDNQSIAIDLPLRVAVWQEKNGSVWLGHDEIQSLAESYGIEGKDISQTISQMTKGLKAAIQYATVPF